MRGQKLTDRQIQKIFGACFQENPDEIIKKIESYDAFYDPESELSAFDQLQICEAIAESTPVRNKHTSPPDDKANDFLGEKDDKTYSSLDGNVLPVNEVVLERVLERLKEYNAGTPPKLIEPLLVELFGSGLETDQWLIVARSYYPRQILWELVHIKKRIKAGREGWTPIENPPAYFAYKMKFRKKRRKNTSSIATCKKR